MGMIRAGLTNLERKDRHPGNRSKYEIPSGLNNTETYVILTKCTTYHTMKTGPNNEITMYEFIVPYAYIQAFQQSS